MESVRKAVAAAVFGPLAATGPVAHAAGSPGVEHNTQSFLGAIEAGGGKPMEQMSPKDARAVLTGAQASVKLQLPKADVQRKTIRSDGQDISLTIVRPAGVKGTPPAFMCIHGGGWVLGDFPTHERLVRDLVNYSGAVAVFVNYAPSPEARYPGRHQPDLGAMRCKVH